MNRRYMFLVCWVAFCSSGSCSSGSSAPDDPCAPRPVVAGGSVELGLGSSFTPVAAGQDVDLQLGSQGLWMFVVSGRVRGMEVGSGSQEGVADGAVLDGSGQQLSVALGCRLREFAKAGDGSMEFTNPLFVPLMPTVTAAVDGATVTLHLEVRDTEGHQATDDRAVVAHVPAQQVQ